MLCYCSNTVQGYYEEAERREDEELITTIREYGSPGTWRYLGARGSDGQDHRAWRRACIREALRRGLIDKDPSDAP